MTVGKIFVHLLTPKVSSGATLVPPRGGIFGKHEIAKRKNMAWRAANSEACKGAGRLKFGMEIVLGSIYPA